jgi:hypothetical protein
LRSLKTCTGTRVGHGTIPTTNAEEFIAAPIKLAISAVELDELKGIARLTDVVADVWAFT